MTTRLSLAYSTCPNDTFAFFGLTRGHVMCPDISFQISLADVETLNQAARSRTYDITKLSFAAMGHLRSNYWLLKSGAALGRGCGPLIVAKPGKSITSLSDSAIAVPGMDTTACLLTGLYLGKPPKASAMTFDRIMPEVSRGNFDYGVIIHEGRFTYQEYGLVSILDLGLWWERQTGLPVPLGCIAAAKNLDLNRVKSVEKAIRDSVAFAFAHPDQTVPYVREHAQEMAPAVIQQHIDLYVNEFSLDIGTEGVRAVETLFSMAQDSGIIPPDSSPLFPG
ncbi:MAG: 1,4-dihydroxy-6-naphthoate synthase [Deltaproteobacteria bacterium]|nr:1,4-dihydroxy-6-naphthoate synthase [Deltaproteobacteria bacterium]